MSDSTPAKVKCQDCGYLALYHLEHTRFEETPQSTRETGEPPILLNVHYKPYSWPPRCFVRAADLVAESDEMTRVGKAQSVLAVITKDRGTCPGFAQWYPGFTPKERLEMQLVEELRRREEERDEKDKRWRQEQEQVAADRQKKQRDVDRTWQEDQAKKARKWAIFTACIGPTLAAVFSVIAYMIGAGKAPPPPQEIRVVYPPPANQPADAEKDK